MWSAAAALSPDLRKRVEIMAEHVARNGSDFENTVKQKNVNNAQFAFLYNGGEGFEYYSHVLASHRGGDNPAGATSNTQQSSVGGGSDELMQALQRWKEPPVFPLGGETDMELTQIIASLEQMASRDAIRNGREWMERNSAIATHIAGQFMKRIVLLPTCAHRLHILFLVHDVLQTEAARKDTSRPLIRSFKPYLAWIVRPCYQQAQITSPNGEESARVLRLLQLWVERGILASRESDEIRSIVTPPELPGIVNKGVMPPTSVPAPAPVPRPSTPSQSPGFAGPNLHSMLGAQHAGANFHQRPMGNPVFAQRPVIHNQQVQIPGAIMPGLNGYKPSMLPSDISKQTPETVPVGVLGTMIQQFIRRNQGSDFIAYRPLDPAATPQQLPAMEVPTQRLLERVEDFYQDLRDEAAENSSGGSSSRSSSRSRSRSPPKASNFGNTMGAVPPPNFG